MTPNPTHVAWLEARGFVRSTDPNWPHGWTHRSDRFGAHFGFGFDESRSQWVAADGRRYGLGSSPRDAVIAYYCKVSNLAYDLDNLAHS